MLEKLGKTFSKEAHNMLMMLTKREATNPHIEDKHEGVMSVPMFSHFRMEVVQFFASAQRRKADEGVRIAHLDPETRMNSKDEYLQGTNLFLVPVRGVGL